MWQTKHSGSVEPLWLVVHHAAAWYTVSLSHGNLSRAWAWCHRVLGVGGAGDAGLRRGAVMLGDSLAGRGKLKNVGQVDTCRPKWGRRGRRHRWERGHPVTAVVGGQRAKMRGGGAPDSHVGMMGRSRAWRQEPVAGGSWTSLVVHRLDVDVSLFCRGTR